MTSKLKLDIASFLMLFSEQSEKTIFRTLEVKKADVYRHTIITLVDLTEELREELARMERRKIKN